MKKGSTGKNGAGRPENVATSYGYVDIWAGVVLVGKAFLPLARQLFSSAHPKLKSQNRAEEAVLFQALGYWNEWGSRPSPSGTEDSGRRNR